MQKRPLTKALCFSGIFAVNFQFRTFLRRSQVLCQRMARFGDVDKEAIDGNGKKLPDEIWFVTANCLLEQNLGQVSFQANLCVVSNKMNSENF